MWDSKRYFISVLVKHKGRKWFIVQISTVLVQEKFVISLISHLHVWLLYFSI